MALNPWIEWGLWPGRTPHTAPGSHPLYFSAFQYMLPEQFPLPSSPFFKDIPYDNSLVQVNCEFALVISFATHGMQTLLRDTDKTQENLQLCGTWTEGAGLVDWKGLLELCKEMKVKKLKMAAVTWGDIDLELIVLLLTQYGFHTTLSSKNISPFTLTDSLLVLAKTPFPHLSHPTATLPWTVARILTALLSSIFKLFATAGDCGHIWQLTLQTFSF